MDMKSSGLSYSWLLGSAAVLASTGIAQVAFATQYLTVPQAQSALFPRASEFRPTLLALTEAQRERIRAAAKTRTPIPQDVWQVFDGTTALGWFVVDKVYGKHEFITYAVALDASGAVQGIEILDYRETHGYQVRNADWRQQFVGKRHGAALKLEQDVRNISGATLSCLHLAEGVKRLLALHQEVLLTTTKPGHG